MCVSVCVHVCLRVCVHQYVRTPVRALVCVCKYEWSCVRGLSCACACFCKIQWLKSPVPSVCVCVPYLDAHIWSETVSLVVVDVSVISG